MPHTDRIAPRISPLLAALLALALLGGARKSEAQNLGPFRQFLALEPYYAFERLDLGPSIDKLNLQGFGARLWINTAPFGVSDHVGVSLFYTHTPVQQNRGATVTHYGGQVELFPVHRPLGGVFDPFITAGAGAFRVNTFGGESGINEGASTRLSVIPGAGFRIPIPNRLELRFDARDAIVFHSTLGTLAGERRTANNLEVTAGLGLTF